MNNTKFIVKLAAIPFAITFVCTLLLVLCNALTKDRIMQLQLEAENTAKTEVLPMAEEFVETQSDITTAAYIGKDSSGNIAGYCFKAEPSGFGGKVSMMVGIDTELNVTGVKIINMAETPGLGAKASEDSWISQFKGKNDTISVVKTGNAKGNEINAISGATITSKAVTQGVNDSIAEAKKLIEKEGK